jgi:hypothetical protein
LYAITIPSINSSISTRWIFYLLKLRYPNKSGVLDIYILGWHTCMSGNHCDNWKKWKWTIIYTCIPPPQIEFSIITACKLYTMYLCKLHKQYSAVPWTKHLIRLSLLIQIVHFHFFPLSQWFPLIHVCHPSIYMSSTPDLLGSLNFKR